MKRADERALREALKDARFAATAAAILHSPGVTNAAGQRCRECGQVWPCRTFRVVARFRDQ